MFSYFDSYLVISVTDFVGLRLTPVAHRKW